MYIIVFDVLECRIELCVCVCEQMKNKAIDDFTNYYIHIN